MTGHLAVFDLGKTNSKLFVFSPAGEIVDEARTAPRWKQHGGFRVLDDEHLFGWMTDALSVMAERHELSGLVHSGHGCTFALVDGDGLTHPILDYEQEPPAPIAAVIDRQIPDFVETFSPVLPLGFNFGRHMLWLEQVRPDAFAPAKAILGYPQYWSWRFSGRAVSEVSYLGCHSHLWAPMARDFSSLVDAHGWRTKMPDFARAGEVLGDFSLKQRDGTSLNLAVHNGVHDSNAALHSYRAAGHESFTLVSTGTWVIIFNADCPLDRLDAERDMLANVRVDGTPVPTIRFMGGREFDVIRDGVDAPVTAEAVQAIIDRGVYALPGFAPGGPSPETAGEVVGGPVDDAERVALALLYVVLMTDLSLDLISSNNTIIVDGGLLNARLLGPLLAQLRLGQSILEADNREGSATGAAILALEAMGHTPAPVKCSPTEAAGFDGLEAYRDAWRAMVEERRTAAHRQNTQAKMMS